MNRRGFLRLLGLAAVGPVAAKLVPSALIADTATTITFPPVGSYPLEITSGEYTIGGYADYCSFSSLTLETSISPILASVSKELSYRLGQSLDSVSLT